MQMSKLNYVILNHHIFLNIKLKLFPDKETIDVLFISISFLFIDLLWLLNVILESISIFFYSTPEPFRFQ
jgi:hypothetical protein